MRDEFGEIRLIPLVEAARIVKVYPEELVQLAIATADQGIYRINMFQGPGGPFFDADECEALDILMGLDEADEAKSSAYKPPPLVLKSH